MATETYEPACTQILVGKPEGQALPKWHYKKGCTNL